MKVIDKRVKKAIESVKPKPQTKSSILNFETYIKMIEKKAYELYENRGGQHGHDQEDWQQAKKLVEDELCKGNEVFEI
ncbi:MAG: DUF2934 domain-containing protein [Candidatus Omnitrophica bacterium]|nr:DUF2934 domain-containing protein [Candidatus Omnitrophota bacterium]MDE2008660.1 DUF2934 domain-containing protein [Candidatus Omnitrophota bacterium]MDE2214957.1 DUF2934 domain-containing protein [Candidatus Omnitrophota bacterium]MDE2230896.1 DUF2934 domain-containing protein [Candidatus Omnitrophota bacterium]